MAARVSRMIGRLGRQGYREDRRFRTQVLGQCFMGLWRAGPSAVGNEVTPGAGGAVAFGLGLVSGRQGEGPPGPQYMPHYFRPGACLQLV